MKLEFERKKRSDLEGIIANDKDEARNFVIKEAKLLGLNYKSLADCADLVDN